MPLFQLPQEPIFPDPRESREDGLLALGGDLSPQRLVEAYRCGIFPWYDEWSPDLLWWSPDPRLVIYPDKFKLSKSLRQKIRRQTFDIRIDTAFSSVIDACSVVPREGQDGTWITDEMKASYIQLHKMGYAHSVECWQNGELVGGLYGMSLGKAFFGESMFHKVSDASKVAFYTLCQLAKQFDFHFIDCQMATDHLISLGAEEISRTVFLDQLYESNQGESLIKNWGELYTK